MNGVQYNPVVFDSGICPICREDLQIQGAAPQNLADLNVGQHIGVNRNVVVLSPCRHTLHDRCAREALAALARCPICRADVNMDLLPPPLAIPFLNRLREANQLGRDTAPDLIGHVGARIASSTLAATAFVGSLVTAGGVSYYVVSNHAAEHAFLDVPSMVIGGTASLTSMIVTAVYSTQVASDLYRGDGNPRLRAVAFSVCRDVIHIGTVATVIEYIGLDAALPNFFLMGGCINAAVYGGLRAMRTPNSDEGYYFAGLMTGALLITNLSYGNPVYQNAVYYSDFFPSIIPTVFHGASVTIATLAVFNAQQLLGRVFSIPRLTPHPEEIVERLDAAVYARVSRLGRYRVTQSIVGGTLVGYELLSRVGSVVLNSFRCCRR